MAESENIVVATAEKIFADLADAQLINRDKSGAYHNRLHRSGARAGKDVADKTGTRDRLPNLNLARQPERSYVSLKLTVSVDHRPRRASHHLSRTPSRKGANDHRSTAA